MQQPFIMKRFNASMPGNVEYYGYCIDLLRYVQEKMANGSDAWEWKPHLYEGWSSIQSIVHNLK